MHLANSFLHSEEAKAGGNLGGVEALAVVADLEVDFWGVEDEGEVEGAGLGVAQGVG